MHTPSMKRSALALIGAYALGCGTDKAPDPLAPTGPVARVRFVDVITDTTRGRVNAILESTPFGVNLTYTQSAPATLPSPATALYSPVYAGARTLVLRRTIDTSVVVATFSPTFVASQDHTIYAIGGAGGGAIASFLSADDNTVPAATSSRVRVVNLSPTGGSMDVFITAAGADLSAATPSVSALANGAASGYLTMPSGTYQVRFVPAGTAPAARAASVVITIAAQALPGGVGRTIVAADNNVGGAPLRAFVLSDS